MSFNKFALGLFAALALPIGQLHVSAQQTKVHRAAPQKLSAQPSVIAPAKSIAQTKPIAAKKSYVEGELLVQFADEKTMQAARTLHARMGATVVREFTEFGGWQQVKLPKGLSVEAALKRYRTAPGVAYAQPNFIYHLTDTTPNDPSFAQQYGPVKISAPLAWDTTTGSSAVVVAIVDTGIRYTHEDLASNMWRNPGEQGLDAQGHDKATNGIDDDGDGYVDDVYGIDTAYNDSDPLDDFGHGTHVAGIVGAVGNNGLGVAGVNWSVQLMAVKMFDASGAGTAVTAIGALPYVLMVKRRGVNILSTMRGSDSAYGFLSGTSMASPMVAGAAALVAAHTPSLSALSIKAALMNSVDVLPQWSNLVVTNGRLNVAHALQNSTV